MYGTDRKQAEAIEAYAAFIVRELRSMRESNHYDDLEASIGDLSITNFTLTADGNGVNYLDIDLVAEDFGTDEKALQFVVAMAYKNHPRSELIPTANGAVVRCYGTRSKQQISMLTFKLNRQELYINIKGKANDSIEKLLWFARTTDLQNTVFLETTPFSKTLGRLEKAGLRR